MNWRLIDDDPTSANYQGDLYLDNENYTFAEIERRSGISRRSLQNYRRTGILWVYRDQQSTSRGDWIKYALRHRTPRPIPRAFHDIIMITSDMKPQLATSAGKRSHRHAGELSHQPDGRTVADQPRN